MSRLAHTKNFRIVKDEKGFKVQKCIYKRFFIWNYFKWIDFINWYGIDEVYYFETKDGALQNILYEIKLNTLESSKL